MEEIHDAVIRFLRSRGIGAVSVTGSTLDTLTIDPPLSPAQRSDLAAALPGLLAEQQTRATADETALKAFQAKATPTVAETAAVVKVLLRALGRAG